ncbi:MAG: hypothetical protein KDD70_04035 [Bdellovibrionales bacterium]|nr:hypothetical protein [Bdellovibrionales bacterium]
MTIYMWIASFAWLCLVTGYSQRKHRARHIPLMLTGIFLDIGLVLFLQITRSAIQTALEFSLSVPAQIHILFSSIALVLYVPILILGAKLVEHKGGPNTKSRHIKIATTALFFRTLGFLFMFSMWKN